MSLHKNTIRKNLTNPLLLWYVIHFFILHVSNTVQEHYVKNVVAQSFKRKYLILFFVVLAFTYVARKHIMTPTKRHRTNVMNVALE